MMRDLLTALQRRMPALSPGVALVILCFCWAAAGACRCSAEPAAREEPPSTARDQSIIDAHTHISLGAAAHAAEVFEASGIELAVNLCGRPWGPALRAHLAEAHEVSAQYPSVEILVFSGVDWRLVDEPDFGALAADDLRRAHAAGARGLKIFKSLGLGVRTHDGALLRVDDERLDPLWQTAGELDIPVAIHTGDPKAFFEPPTPENERYEELSAHPSWSFYGKDYPSLEALLAARDRMVARHPRTRFISVHVGGYAEDLSAVARSLRTHPNLYIDVAARVPEIGRHKASIVRAFFQEFHDRILFGTDLAVNPRGTVLGSGAPGEYESFDAARDYYAVHWAYFGTAKKGIEHVTPIQGKFTIDGIDLPQKILDELYRENAQRVLRLDTP